MFLQILSNLVIIVNENCGERHWINITITPFYYKVDKTFDWRVSTVPVFGCNYNLFIRKNDLLLYQEFTMIENNKLTTLVEILYAQTSTW